MIAMTDKRKMRSSASSALRAGEPAITLRHAVAGDEPFLRRVYASTRAEELALTDWDDQKKEAFVTMQFEAQHRQYREHFPDADYLLVLIDGKEAGRLYLHRREKEIRIVDIALLPEYRNRGTGTALLRDILAEGDEAAKPVTIHVEIFNPALRLYERLGFKRVRDKGVYYLMEHAPASAGGAPAQEKGLMHG